MAFKWLRRQPADTFNARAAAGGRLAEGVSPAANKDGVIKKPRNPIDVAREVKLATPRRQTAGEIAVAVLRHMRDNPYDCYWANFEVDAWIDDWSQFAGIPLDVPHAKIRAAMKQQPGVTYELVRVRRQEQFAAIRKRMAVHFDGGVPEKAWVFGVLPYIADEGHVPMAMTAPETISQSVLAKGLAAAKAADQRGGVPAASQRRACDEAVAAENRHSADQRRNQSGFRKAA